MTEKIVFKFEKLSPRLQITLVLLASMLLCAASALAAEEYPLQEARSLYLDLMNFACEPRFHRFGLSEKGPYADWKEHFQELFSSNQAISEFSSCTRYDPVVLLDLAAKLSKQSGRPDEETQQTINLLNNALLVQPSDYSPAPDIRILEGRRLDAEIEGTYGPVTPIMEAQDYWLLYLNGADVTLVVQDGVIERTLKGRHGARRLHMGD